MSFSCDQKVSFDESIYKPLHWQLNEISGLTSDEKNLFAINDEKGIIFALNPLDYKIERRIKFKKKGDYEGIAFVLGLFYILKSNGDILQLSATGEILQKYKRPKAFEGIEFEGMCFEKRSNQLLLLCKKHSNEKKDNDIIIYSFSLKNKDYKKDEFVKIRKGKEFKEFTPTGIEYSNNYIYVISSKTTELLTYDNKSKKVQNLKSFNSDALPQIEGLTLHDNRLYLASEKNKNKSAIIYSFSLE